MAFTRHASIGDFGNYYYGSKLFLDGKFNENIYASVQYFNSQVAAYGQENFFGNYIPVPPFSALFYLPLTFLKAKTAKILFVLFSLILFCFCFYRLVLNTEFSRSKVLYLVPLIFIFPIYNNVVQGQSYLLISSLLIIAFLTFETDKVLIPALCVSICACLKLFPIIFVFYFLVRRKRKLAITTAIFSLILFFSPIVLMNVQIVVKYLTEITPRLMENDVVGKYNASNQSIHSLLLKLFSQDTLDNPQPFFDSPILALVLDSLFAGLVLSFLIQSTRNSTLVSFNLFLIGSLLLSRYTASYMMVFLAPGALFAAKERTLKSMILLLLIFLACTVSLIQMPDILVLKYARLFSLIGVFTYFIYLKKIKLQIRLSAILVLLMLAFRFFSFQNEQVGYFPIQNTQGILYDIELKNDSLVLKSTLGMKEHFEKIKSNGRILETDQLRVIDKKIYYKDKLVVDGKDNKLKPFIFNDSLVVYMSDLGQGVGFFKLRIIPLRH